MRLNEPVTNQLWPGLLARFERDLAAEPAGIRGRVRAEQGLIEDYPERAGASRFPAVLCMAC